jgi:hypothetical protein
VAMDLGVPEARGALSRLLLRWAPRPLIFS